MTYVVHGPEQLDALLNVADPDDVIQVRAAVLSYWAAKQISGWGLPSKKPEPVDTQTAFQNLPVVADLISQLHQVRQAGTHSVCTSRMASANKLYPCELAADHAELPHVNTSAGMVWG